MDFFTLCETNLCEINHDLEFIIIASATTENNICKTQWIRERNFEFFIEFHQVGPSGHRTSEKLFVEVWIPLKSKIKGRFGIEECLMISEATEQILVDRYFGG